MRVACQKCAAPYAVEDRLLATKGVRAQCPRCRHLQWVESPATGVAPVGERDASPFGREGLGSSEEPTCQSCGKVLEDSSDVALQSCETCRAVSAGGLGKSRPSTASVSREAGPGEALARNPENDPGLDSDSLFSGAIEGLEDVEAAESQEVSSALERPALTPPRPRRSTADRVPRSGRIGHSKALFLIPVAVLWVAAGVTFWKVRAARAAKLAAAAAQASLAASLDAPVELPEGSSEEYETVAAEHLALDTPRAYARAMQEFEKALAMDPRRPRAIAGWVKAVALGGAPLDQATYEKALALLEPAEKRSEGNAGLLTAHALLILRHRGSANDARALAEHALSRADAKQRAEAELALGMTYLDTNGNWAAKSFEKALELDPSSKRAHLLLGKALAEIGDYRGAISRLNHRLELDADQWEASDALAQLFVEVGELDKAKRVLQAAQRIAMASPWPTLRLAMLAYQQEGKGDVAIEALAGLVRKKERLSEQEQLAARVHLATALRLAGQADAASREALAALAIDATDAGATLQLLLLALQRSDPIEARTRFSALSGKLGDAGLEKTLEGRLLSLEKKPLEALEAFDQAVQADTRRTDALLLAGAVASEAKLPARAYGYALQRGLKADPETSGPRPVLGELYLRPGELLSAAQGRYLGLATSPEDPNPHLCEGLVAFHFGDLAGADRQFQKVLAADVANGPALAFRALIALRRGDKAEGLKSGALATGSGRPIGVAEYALGLALASLQKEDEARRALQSALSATPGLLGPRVQLGMLELRANQIPQARAQFTTVVGIDPTYPGGKRGLYLLDK